MIDCSSIECCGCSACKSVCPKSIIQMIENREGFLEPQIIDKEKCIKCGLCEKVCPIINPCEEKKNENELAYIVQHINEDIRKESASGGAFSAIAEHILQCNGSVYGAAYDKDFYVKHVGIDDVSDLEKLRHSKYVQSDLDNTFSEIKKKLDRNELVCFCGTPCQTEGLISFLRKDYRNLIVIDLCCHGVSSPLIWRKYVQMNKKYEPDHIYFRWKHYGYKYSTISFFKNGKEVYYSGVESDPMLRAYFTNSCDRLSCYNCKFKKRYRKSDITIWDCFQPGFFDKNFDDDRGTTSVLVNTRKGKEVLEALITNKKIKALEVKTEDLVLGNKELVSSVKRNEIRETFLESANILDGKELFDEFFPITYKQKIKKILRMFLVNSRLYARVKYIIYYNRRKG